jgi:hypothetical protein
MGIAKVLAPVTGAPRDAGVLAAAIAAARPFAAHVMAYFVRPDLTEALAFFTDGVSGVVVDDVVRATQEAGDEAAKRIETTLAATCAAAAIERVSKPLRTGEVTLSLRETQGNFADRLTAAARLSDLIVFPPMREGDQAGLAEAFVQVLVETDRPVLRATDNMPKLFARRIAVGWDGKTAAASALNAAMPYLQNADQVEILSIHRGPPKAEATEAAVLDSHGGTVARNNLLLCGDCQSARSLEADGEGGARRPSLSRRNGYGVFRNGRIVS